MLETHKDKSLSGEIFRNVSVFTIAVVLGLSLVLSILYFFSYEQDAESKLIAQANRVAVYLNELGYPEYIEVLEGQFSGELRYTLIAPNGTVLYDSLGSFEEFENHADRPEVIAAEEAGQATAVRYSKTLQTDTVYAAVKLDDGNLIRLAETRYSLIAFWGWWLVPAVVASCTVIALVFILSKILTRRIMRPIDALDFTRPLENDIYDEMEPLLERIDQQQTLLKQQNLELAEAENLRRDFSANVSHEMKTPLQVISGYAELMKNDMVAPEDRQRFVELIYDEAQAMRLLIDDVLTLSRLDESAIGDTEDLIEVYALGWQVKKRLEGFADAQKVTVLIEGEKSCIRGNKVLAEEMIYNLIENGIRYNHKNGQVVFTTKTLEDEVVVEVSDTGAGMPDNMKEKVFERFFRIDKSRSKETGGTGLGLAIVKHAVQYHKGTIEVHTKLGAGTSFVMRFPSADCNL